MTTFLRFFFANVAFVSIGYEIASGSSPRWLVSPFALGFCIVLAVHNTRMLLRAYEREDRAMAAFQRRGLALNEVGDEQFLSS